MLNLTCTNCLISKPTDAFYIDTAYRSGYRSMCKECMKTKYHSKYQKKPPEYFENRRLERQKEKLNLKIELQRIRNEKKELERPLKEALAKEKKKQQKAIERKKTRSKPGARRVEKINVRCDGLGKLSKGIIKELLIRQDYKCVYCGTDISISRHVDHIVPLALGGLNTDDNVQLTCPPCNIEKSDTHPLLFKHDLDDVPAWLNPLP